MLLFGFRIRRAVASIVGNSSEMTVVTSLLVSWKIAENYKRVLKVASFF